MKNILFLAFWILPLFTFSQFQIDSVVTTDATCASGTDGTLTIYTSGGTGTETYDIGFGSQTSNIFTNLSCGSYTSIAVDATPTMVTGMGTVNCPGPLVLTDYSSMISCNGVCDGQIVVEVTGGSLPYSAVVLPFGGSDPSFSNTTFFGNICAGTYSVDVTDQNGCQGMIITTITEPDPLIATVTSTPETVYGACDGTSTVSVIGGTSGYVYAWQDCLSGDPVMQFGGTINNLCPSMYGAVVTDNNNCVATSSCSTVIVGACNVASTYFEVANTCFGSCDGILEITTTGGAAPYLVTDPFGAVTSYSSFVSLFGYCAGTYTFEIEDANGCTETIVATFTEPAPLVAILSATDETSAGACDGTLIATSFGGTIPYVYTSWQDCSSGSPITMPSAVCPGDYSVTTMDANGCSVTSSCEAVGTMSCNLVATYQMLQDPCEGQCNGAADVIISGGTGPYTITDPNGGPDETFSINWIFTNLCGGNHVVTITDANGCTFNLTLSIWELPPLDVVVTTTDETIGGACDGTVASTVWGGASFGYTYDWYNCSNNQSAGTADSVGGLCPGDYGVVVMDAYGCMGSSFCETVDPGPICSVTSSVQTTESLCYGACDGSVLINTTGGTLPYTVNDPMTGSIVTYSSAQVLGGICPGSYVLVIEDAVGCTETYNVIITEPTEVIHSVVVVDESAFGSCDGSITVAATGGTPGYMYSINCSGSFQSSPVFSGLCNGAYGVTVADAAGCFSYCDSIDTIGTLNSVGVNTDDFTDISVYPNPAKDEITIDFIGGNIAVSVFTILGELIYSERLIGKRKVEVSGWTRGVYMLKLEVGNESVVKRLVIE